MLFSLNAPLPLLLIRSTLRSARHARALFCQKLNLHGKQLLGQGAESPLGAWACLPQTWVLALLGREGGKTLGLTRSRSATGGTALAFSGSGLSLVK